MSDPSLRASSLRGAVDLSSLVRAAQQPAAPAPGAAEDGIVREVDEQSFPAILELSRAVPVVIEFYADGIAPALPALVRAYGGRLLLGTVDGNRNPQLAQAFQIQQVPAVVALIGARPIPLFLGMPSESEVRAVLDQVLEAAAQSGITGTVPVESGAAEEPVDEPLPPLHQEAYDAIATGDLPAAAQAYRTAIAQNPRDQLAVAGLAQVSLLQRLDGVVAADVRRAAAEAPDDADAQLAVADLDLSGGHVEDALARLLRVFPSQTAEGRAAIRTRLLDYFEIVGVDDPRTVAARRALSALLY